MMAGRASHQVQGNRVGLMVLVAAMALSARCVFGQDAVSPFETTVEPMPVEAVLADIGAAYSAGVWGEEVRVAVRRGDQEVRADRFEVMFDPVAFGGGGYAGGARLRLRLGLLEVSAATIDTATGRAVRIVSAHISDPTSAFAIERSGPLDAALLAECLPPLPLPQLVLAARGGDGVGAPVAIAPYTGPVRWTVARNESSPLFDRLVVEGEADNDRVVMVADAESSRLISMNFDLDPASGRGESVRLEFLALTDAAFPPAGRWAISTEGRTLVASIGDLRRRPGDVKVGDRVPEMLFQSAGHTEWTVAEDLDRAVSAADSGTAEAVALLLFREAYAERTSDGGASAIDSAATTLTDLTGLSERQRLLGRVEGDDPALVFFAWRPALVLLAADGMTLDMVERTGAEWGRSGTSEGRLVWSASGATSLDRFAPDADGAVVVIGKDRVIRGVAPLLADDQPDAVRARIVAALAR